MFAQLAATKFGKYLYKLFLDRSFFWQFASLIILGDAVLTQLIIRFVPYTEIDWETYMYHIELFAKGERDYSLIEGPTGHLVYPAGHVYIHRLLYILTNAGGNLALAQQLYGALYILSLILTCATYQLANAPNWVLLLLPLSRRVHSIYVLRLFNDCWAVVSVQAAIYAYGRTWDNTATLLYAVAVSIKMSNLLYFPGILVVLFKRRGAFATARHFLVILLAQGLLGLPFLIEYPLEYLTGAFDLSRVFLYKWTVNWRFVDEAIFLSPGWSKGLLICHSCALIIFGLFKWCREDGGVAQVLIRGLRSPFAPAAVVPVTPNYVITVLFTSNLIGILFARSLHYQFYSWYSQQIPLIAWKTDYPVLAKIALLATIEYAWNVFPSTVASSGALCVANAILVLGLFAHSESHSKTRDRKSR